MPKRITYRYSNIQYNEPLILRTEEFFFKRASKVYGIYRDEYGDFETDVYRGCFKYMPHRPLDMPKWFHGPDKE